MSENLPDKIRPLTEILTLSKNELTEYEAQVVTLYHEVLEHDKQDEHNVDPEFLKIGTYATNNSAGFVFPDDTTTKEIEVIILLHKKHQVYYGPKTDDYPEGPRYCEAFGNDIGVPTEIGSKMVPFLKKGPFECESCFANTFGSGGGNSKACKNQFRCIVKHPNFEKPLRFHIPPSSRTDFNTYVNIAETNNKPLCCWYTKITAKFESAGGNDWAVMEFDRVREIEPEHLLAVMQMHIQLDGAWTKQKAAVEGGPGRAQKGQEPPVQEDVPPPSDEDKLPF